MKKLRLHPKVIPLLKKRIPLYRKDPVLFAREILDFQPDDWQIEALRALADNRFVAIKSGQGVGKTGIEAVALLWFLFCFPFPRVVCTAPTRQQLNDVLWSEISKWMSRSDIITSQFTWTKTYIVKDGYEKRWFAAAKTATKAENMQGYHEDNMLFIVDEASGVPDDIMEAIKGTLGGKNNKLLLCGNPTRTTGAFFDAFNADAGLYWTKTVNSLDSPRTNKETLNSMIAKYGADSNFVRVRIKGQFPKSEDDVLIPLDLIEENLKVKSRTFDDEGNVLVPIQRIDIGCDVARFGDDKTIIGYRINEVVKIHKKLKGGDTVAVAREVVSLAMMLSAKYKYRGIISIRIDDNGVGGGVTDSIKSMIREDKKKEVQRYKQLRVTPVLFGVTLSRNFLFADTTTFYMNNLKDQISMVDADGNPKEPDLILPDDPDLIRQLSSRKYEITSASKMLVESKKVYKKRNNGQSPDEADCILLVSLPLNYETLERGE